MINKKLSKKRISTKRWKSKKRKHVLRGGEKINTKRLYNNAKPKNKKLLSNGNIWEGVTMIETQISTQCGYHALKNLLQEHFDTNQLSTYVQSMRNEDKNKLLKNINERLDTDQIIDIDIDIDMFSRIFQNIGSCSKEMLTPKEIITVFIAFINEKEKQDNYKIEKTTLPKKESNSIQINDFINMYPEFNCKGFIDNINAGHYVAWLKRSEYWFFIDSLDLSGNKSDKGTIIKYTQEEFDNIFNKRTGITGLLFIYEKTADTVGENTTKPKSTVKEEKDKNASKTKNTAEHIDGTMVCPKP